MLTSRSPPSLRIALPVPQQEFSYSALICLCRARHDPPRRSPHHPPACPRGELPPFTPVPRQTHRRDGWTKERQRAFIEALADTGSVASACKAVDMSQPGAYYLRRQKGAEEFREAWQKALDLGVQRLEDVAMDRALERG